jgi:hypothetical protein
MALGSSGVPPNSTYKIAPASNRLQKKHVRWRLPRGHGLWRY